MNTQIFWGIKKAFLKCLWLLFSFQPSPILSQKLPNLQCHCFHFLVFHLHFGKTFQVCLPSTALIQHSIVSTFYTLGFSLWLSSKESVCSARVAGDIWFDLWIRKIPWRKACILARKIPWTEEPGGLQPTGLQTVGQD